jgi:hypothetical protein
VGDDSGRQLRQDNGNAVAQGDAVRSQRIGETVGQLGEVAKGVSFDAAVQLLVN